MNKRKGIIVNISLPKEVLEKFDRVAENQHWNRSTLIRLAIEYYLVTHYLPIPKPPKEKGGKDE